MLHPDTELRIVDKEVGYGVFATEPIPKGTITWVLDELDQVFEGRRFAGLERKYREELERYTWVDNRGNRILCWDFGRFMNHSCEANSFSPGGFDFEIAVRDIEVGEQLTSDYGALNIEKPLFCRCGSPACRGVIRSGDFEAHAAAWDEQIRPAFQRLQSVEQPLWRLIHRYASVIDHLVETPDDIPSILMHRLLDRPLALAGGGVSGA